MKQKNFVWAQDYSLGPEWRWDPNFKFQMFSNGILSDIIAIKAVTEKTVGNLNLNLKFLSNGNFRWWAFRNYAYFVMKPSGYATQWGCAWGPYIYVDLRFFRMLLRWKFSNLNFESKKVCRSIWRDLAVILQYFLCIISQFKYCYKASLPPLHMYVSEDHARAANHLAGAFAKSI